MSDLVEYGMMFAQQRAYTQSRYWRAVADDAGNSGAETDRQVAVAAAVAWETVAAAVRCARDGDPDRVAIGERLAAAQLVFIRGVHGEAVTSTTAEAVEVAEEAHQVVAEILAYASKPPSEGEPHE